VLLLTFVSSISLEPSLLFHPTSSRKLEFATSLFELPRPLHTCSFSFSYQLEINSLVILLSMSLRPPMKLGLSLLLNIILLRGSGAITPFIYVFTKQLIQFTK